MERRASVGLLSVLFFGIAMLYVPILVLIGYSFNASPLVNVWGGFSTAWYRQLLHNRQLLEAALLSLEVAVAASTGAIVLGTLAAISLVRFARFPGRTSARPRRAPSSRSRCRSSPRRSSPAGCCASRSRSMTW